MKNLWIARLKDITPGGSDELGIFDDFEAAMDKARFFWHNLTTLEKDRHEVSVECYSVDCPDSATKYEAYEALNDSLCWPDPVYFGRLYILVYFRSQFVDGEKVPPEDAVVDALFEESQICVFAETESDANQKGREALAAHYRDLGYTAKIDPHGVTVCHDGVEEWYYGFNIN